MGYNTSTDLPNKVLQFVRDHPLMDDSVNPIGDSPVLLRRGSNYTRIVVDRVTGLDQQMYDVMFLGTGKSCYCRKRDSPLCCILCQIFFETSKNSNSSSALFEVLHSEAVLLV